MTVSGRFFKGAGFAVVLVPSPRGGDARPTFSGAARRRRCECRRDEGPMRRMVSGGAPWARESKTTGFRGRGRAGLGLLRGTNSVERGA